MVVASHSFDLPRGVGGTGSLKNNARMTVTLRAAEVGMGSRTQDFEDMQKAKMALVARETKPRQLKRYIDESTIEVNFKEREALLDKQEEEAKRRIVEKNVEMRRVLAAQLREKEWRRKQMADEEATRFGIFKKSLDEAQAADSASKPHKGAAQKVVRDGLDKQLREKAMRDENPTMSEIEKVLNLPILKRLEQQKALRAMGQ